MARNVIEGLSDRPFGLRDKVGYLFGDFGNDFTFILSTTILMKFYTDVIGITPEHVGLVMMIARLVDALTDVTMGRIVDRLRPGRDGKFRRWLKWMCVPVAVSSFLMYQTWVAGIASYGVRLGYLFVTYILWGSVFYTSINIPYGSMASAISPEPGDRQSLSTFRSMGATLAGTFIGVGLPLLAYEQRTTGDGSGVVTVLSGSRVVLAAGIFSVLAVVCYLLCYGMTAERVPMDPPARRQDSVMTMLRHAMQNRALIAIIAASVMMLLAQLTMQTMSSYLYPDYYNSAAAQSAATVMMMAGMVVAAVLAKPLAARFGKAEVSAVSCLFAGVVALVTWLLRPGNVGIFILLQTLDWLGLGIFTMMSWAMITDVIDYAEIRNGVREDGAVYALYSFARKMGQALTSGITGWLMGMVGYQAAVDGAAVQQSAGTLRGIFDIATLVPAVGFLALAAVLWWWYPLKKGQVEAQVARLKTLHGDKNP